MTDRDANERLLRLNAALDGELDAMGSLEFERELRDDAALAAEYRRLAALRDAVRRHAPREAAPQALADRIAALTASAPTASSPQAAAAPTATVVPFRPRPWLDKSALAMAASFAVLGLAVGAGLTSLRTPAGSDVARHLVSDFARAEIAGQPFDVASSDRHTVKPWLANRTTVSGTIVDLAPEGFPLVGGRVTIVDRVPTPTLVYRHNEHVVAVTELPLDAKGVRSGTGGIETIDGYHVARWSDPDLNYVAVSDMDEKALGEFIEAFRRGGGPAPEPAKP
jgi:anti-sigma factor RsiW